MLNCKKKTASYKKHSGTMLDQFQQMVPRYCNFRVYAIFSNSPRGPF